MKNRILKNGFTLIELLAVIAILALLSIIVIPNILGMYNKSKKSIFLIQAKKIYNSAKEQFSVENIISTASNKNVYCYLERDEYNNLDLLGNSKVYYRVIFDSKGNVISNIVFNDKYSISTMNDIEEYTTDDVSQKGDENYSSISSCANAVADSCFTVSDAGVLQTYDYDNCGPDVVIPNKIGETTVSSIKNCDMYTTDLFRNKGITSVYIPDTITYIGSNAFADNNIQTIYIPDSVIETGEEAFSNCNLNKVRLSENMNKIAKYAFYNNHLTSIYIPNSVESIGLEAFYNNNIKKVVIPNNVYEINDGAFANNNIESVSFPSSLKTINYYSFQNNNISSIVIPSSVNRIDEGAFFENNITQVEIKSNDENNKYRFNFQWEMIGFPSSLKAESNYKEVTLTTGVNNFTYNDSYYKVNIANTGNYKLEVWGAPGFANKYGSGYNNGGYSYGNIHLNTSDVLYIFVGSRGSSYLGGYNGGGSTNYGGVSYIYNSGGGGGATDIRVNSTSLYSRVIVAGGSGGGSGGWACRSGNGGGISGGGSYGIISSSCGKSGGGGTQISGGSGGIVYSITGVSGTFGIGASSNVATDTGGGAGGAGWYGGGSGSNYGSSNGGGGGSGWIYTESAYNTWIAGNSSDAEKYTLNSNYYLSNANTLSEDQGFEKPSNDFNINGNGYARITYLEE